MDLNMFRHKSCVILLFAIGFPLICSGQRVFEGTTIYRLTTPKATNEVTFFCKYSVSKIKIYMSDKEVQIVFDRDSQKMTMIIPQDRIYTIQTLKGDNGESKPNSAVSKEKQETVTLPQLTGQTKKILGYECEQWMERSNNGETELWLTKELGAFNAMSIFAVGNKAKSASGIGVKMIGGAFLPMMKGITLNDYFPVQIIIRNAQGLVVSRVEAVSIQPQALDAALFQPPADFQKSVGSE